MTEDEIRFNKKFIWMRENEPEKLAKVLRAMSEEELKSILYDWNLWARPNQLAPKGDWRTWLVLAGRGFGKTRCANEWVIQRAREGKGPIALIGKTTSDVRDTIIEVGESSIMKISHPDFKPIYEPSKRRLTWPNGVTATTFSGDEWDQLRGPQHRTVLIDELPKFANPEELYTQMDMGLRIGDDAQCIVSTTPLPIKIIKELYEKSQIEGSDVVLSTGSTMDNAANLGKRSVASMVARYKGTRMERQELYGEILWSSEDALFTNENLDEFRISLEALPEMVRIVVAVDPAVTNNKNSDSTAIVVAGMDARGHGYVLFDGTMKGTPSAWAKRTVALYDEYCADVVSVETNQGGDLVVSTLEQQRRNLPIKKIHASKSKIARMEPISLLAEQGKVHMVGYFKELEQQCVEYSGKGPSPDRYDAMCYALSELMLGKVSSASTSQFHY